jgi:Sec-independent protein translocase protein TatA
LGAKRVAAARASIHPTRHRRRARELHARALYAAAVFAFLPTLGWQEMFLLLVIGLLLYGRNLPQAGRTMGRFVAQLKRGFDEFKSQMDRDESLREVRKTFEDTSREVRNLTSLPRTLANPVQELKHLAHDAMTRPGADANANAHEGLADEDRADEPPPANEVNAVAAPNSVSSQSSPVVPTAPKSEPPKSD